MFKPAWHSDNAHPMYEYFVSKDGWCITYTRHSGVYTEKYILSNFSKVNSINIISVLNRELIEHFFIYGWNKLSHDKDVEFLN